MSTAAAPAVPTQEQVRAARHSGFQRSLSPILPPERYKRIAASYAKQDARREKNVSNFVSTVSGRR